MDSQKFNQSQLSGRNRRLLYEWHHLEEGLSENSNISFQVVRWNVAGLPIGYLVDYHLRSICGVQHVDHLNEPGVVNSPIFAKAFRCGLICPWAIRV